jgi:hypothetical protein
VISQKRNTAVYIGAMGIHATMFGIGYWIWHIVNPLENMPKNVGCKILLMRRGVYI